MSTRANALSETQIALAVSREADKKDFYELAERLGHYAAVVLQKEHRSQMTGLEAVVNGTLKRSDVLDYVKKQIGRLDEWRKPCSDDQRDPQTGFGERLLQALGGDLGDRAGRLCEELGVDEETEEGRQLRRRLHLLLMRRFIRSMVAHYEWRSIMEKTRLLDAFVERRS
ncbi:hypothetical protein [Thermogemmatispora tikiterensis]|uniref:Uncharacterized protein n=1 Tax=Thermogemmatispora tikiterensis TaxID=1825093 RepID=A0A328VKE8_9CHLR|nr:hypothetical protein [Thermogemmatispora tikiterensis]RAQ96013.1 hypothetical protein A4R35_10750 [Thermogemmatispora tikiterensis]